MTLDSRRERAQQFADFVEDAKRQPGIYSLSMRYAKVLCLLETVWKSRRELQEAFDDLDEQLATEEAGRTAALMNLSVVRGQRDEARARVRELEAFVADIACHGLRTDLTPTFMVSSVEQYAAAVLRYLRSADKNLRADARKFVPDADRPRNAGRPIPAPKVEIVADAETELGLLLAQKRATEGGGQ